MTTPRRDFLKVATGAIGAVGVTRIAPWVVEIEAAQAAVADASKYDVADAALATAKRLGASYADIRVNRLETEAIATREQQVQTVARNQSFGFGIRVLLDGTWGFAASPFVTPQDARRVTESAIEIARALPDGNDFISGMIQDRTRMEQAKSTPAGGPYCRVIRAPAPPGKAKP